MKTWLITGANRGLGLAIARAALDGGDQVVATARAPIQITEALPGREGALRAVKLDFTEPSTVGSAVDEAIRAFGRIDVLVNNAGYGQLGAFEEVGPEAVARQFATNVFGVFDVTRSVLPVMRRQRSGHIFTVSSIAGIEGGAGSSIYSATKHAVSGWSESLAQEVAPFGIHVTCLYPGRFRTDFLDGSSVRYGEAEIDDYKEASTQRKAALDADSHRQIGDPSKFAQVVVSLAAAKNPPIRLGTGSDAYAVFQGKAAALARSVEDWKDLVLSTDFAE